MTAVWGPETAIHWKVKVPGVAWSSPIVWGERVLVTTAVPEGEQEKPRKGLYFGGDRYKPREAVYSWELLCVREKR